jgi:hypothetical protein
MRPLLAAALRPTSAAFGRGSSCPVGHLQWRSMSVSTARRWCPKCEQEYVATVYAERQAGEVSLASASRCPDCDGEGQLLADVPPDIGLR